MRTVTAGFLAGCALGVMTLLGATLPAAPALAQEDVIARCATLPAAERIVCLENALLERGDGGGIRIPIPFFGGDDDDDAPAAPAAPGAPAAQPDNSLGAEQVAVRDGTFDDQEYREANVRSLAATVTSKAFDVRGRLVVGLDNGQVWRQTEQLTFPVDADLSDQVEIRESSFGGYRMTLFASDREIKVERLE